METITMATETGNGAFISSQCHFIHIKRTTVNLNVVQNYTLTVNEQTLDVLGDLIHS